MNAPLYAFLKRLLPCVLPSKRRRITRVRPRNYNEIRVLPRLHRSDDTLQVRLHVHHVFSRELPASLRERLVLNVAPRDARGLQQRDCARDVQRAAKAGVGIGDDGSVGDANDHARDIREFVAIDDRQVGLADGGAGGAATGEIERVEAGRVGDVGGDAVEDPRADYAVLYNEESAQLRWGSEKQTVWMLRTLLHKLPEFLGLAELVRDRERHVDR